MFSGSETTKQQQPSASLTAQIRSAVLFLIAMPSQMRFAVHLFNRAAQLIAGRPSVVAALAATYVSMAN